MTTTQKPKPKPKPSTKSTKSTTTTTTPPGDDLASILRANGLDPNLLSAGTTDSLYTSEEASVRNFDIYVGANYGFTGTSGGVKTKIKAKDLLDGLRTMDTARYRALQEKLFAGGFYGTADRRNVAFGNRNDMDTRVALSRAIANNVLANQQTTRTTRISLDNILDEAVANAPAAIGAGGTTQPYSYQPPDPQALRKAISDELPDLLGHTLSPDEVDAIATKFEAKLQAADQSNYNANLNGGTALPKPDLNTFVASEAERLHPDDAGAKKLANLSSQFFQAINSNQPPVDRVF